MQVRSHPPLQIELLPRGRVFTWGYYPYPQLLQVLRTFTPVQRTSVSSVQYDIHTRTRNFTKICTTVPQYPGYGYSIFIPARNFCKFCTPVPQYPELLEVLQDFHTRTRKFCESCHNTRGTGTACSYLPGTSVSSVRPCHNTRNFWKFCKTFIPVPGNSVSPVGHSYPYPELL